MASVELVKASVYCTCICFLSTTITLTHTSFNIHYVKIDPTPNSTVQYRGHCDIDYRIAGKFRGVKNSFNSRKGGFRE